MKINKKLIAPALTLVGLMAMGVGTTYALFTSNAETDTVISAGKVEYAQTAEDLTTYSGVDITGDPAVDVLAPTTVNGTFTLGGSASYESGVITLNKMTPGDKVTFTLKVKNSSNVTSKFRVYREITEDTGLFDGLKVKVNGEDWDGTTAYSAWVAKDGVSAAEEVKTIEVSIELPTDKGNEFENKTCKIRFGMDAVQGNAKVSNPMSIYNGETFVEDAFDLKTALNSCKSTGYTLKLNEDIDLRKWAPIDGWGSTPFNIDGQGHKISGAVISGVDNGGLFGAVTGAMTVKNVTFEDFDITTNIGKQKYAGVFVGKTYSPIAFDNVTVADCKISNTWQCGGLVGFGEYTTVTYKDCLVEDCFFGGNNATAGTLFGLGTTDVTVTDCEAKNVMLYTDSLDWNSTAKAKGHFAVGHLYTNTLTDTNYVETNVKVYLADGFALNKAGEYEVSNAAGLVYFGNQVDTGKNLFSEKVVKLTDDIDMTGIDFDPIGEMGYAISGANVFCGTFDGQNHSIKNLTATDQKSAGLFAAISYVVKNVVIDGATINSNHYAGGIVGWTESGPLTKIENCTVKNSTIKSTVEWTGTEWDNGDKAGGITGYTASQPTIIGCTVSDCTVQGYRDIGGLIGYCSTGIITNNTVKNVTVNNDRTNGYKPYTTDAEYDCNQLIGENAGGTLSGNTTTNVTVVAL